MSLRWEMRRLHPVPWRAGALLLLLALGALSLSLGAVPISACSFGDLIASALGLASPWSHTQVQEAVFWSIRLPRVLLGCLVGGGLGLAGAALQGLFRNPLADPALIGVSSGAAVGAALVIVLLPAAWGAALGSWGAFALPLAASLGGLAATWAVYRLATKHAQTSVETLLLAGVALNALCGAAIGLLTYLSDEAALRSLTLWSLGSLGGATWSAVLVVAPCILLGGWGTLRQARALNLLLLGEAEARHMGVHVHRVKLVVVALCALLVGAGVGFTGIIGFVGLVGPHLVRLLWGPDHKRLLWGAAWMGALLLMAADLTCRLVVAPAELPLGVVMALLGAPFFLWLMSRRVGRGAL